MSFNCSATDNTIINNSLNEMSVYFDDILRNKDMIKEMFKTNIMVYEDKIKQNNEKISKLKEDLNRINSDFSLVESKLKLDYAKNHDQFQKHDINFKLLDKTNLHYRMLIREREDEIKKIEEQTIFAHQDYQNKKIKLDCIDVQIVEAEFQLENLKKKLDEQINKQIGREMSNVNNAVNNLKDDNESDEETVEYNNTKSTVPNLNVESEKHKINDVDKFLSEKMAYKSTYSNRESVVFDTIMNSEKMRPNKCVIF